MKRDELTSVLASLGFFGSVLRADFDPSSGSDVDATGQFRDAPGLPSARQYFDFEAALEQCLGMPVHVEAA